MAEINHKKKLAGGLIWSATERFAVQGIQFVLGIILARLLAPSDFGLIGMLAIFIAIAQCFVDSGFSWALIQKKDRTETDYTTTFYTNTVLGLIFYVLLFFSAPWIARFYGFEELNMLTRVFGLNIIVVSFSVVHRARLTIEIDFKTQAKASLIGVLFGGVVGITMALNGYGVWSLAWQYLVQNTTNTVVLWVLVKWWPKESFSRQSFNGLFRFGSKLLGANLLETIYDNVYLIVIGKFFSASSLGYYTRAQQLQRMPSLHLTHIIQRVAFPVLSEVQDDEQQLREGFRKLLRFASFIIFPLMMILMILAEPFVSVVLTDKWLPSVPLLQWLCIAGMLFPVNVLNLNLLNVKGRSDLYLKMEIIQKVLITLAILITFSFGIEAMVIGQVVVAVLGVFLSTFYTGRLLHYGLLKQVKDVLPVVFNTGIITLIMYFALLNLEDSLLKLIVGTGIGLILYIGGARLFQYNEFNRMREMLLAVFRK